MSEPRTRYGAHFPGLGSGRVPGLLVVRAFSFWRGGDRVSG